MKKNNSNIWKKSLVGLFTVLIVLITTIICFDCEQVSAQDSNGDYVIIIDPGHGGYDGGASAVTGDNEADLNWEIVKYMKSELETYAGVKVYITRASNEWNTNTGRGKLGESLNADLCISVHNNSSGAASTSGFVAYGSVQPAYKGDTAVLGPIFAKYAASAGLDLFSGGYLTRQATNDPNRDFYTLIDEGCQSGYPSMILETCFLSNSSNANYIHEPSNQLKVGVAYAKAVAEYFGLSKRTVTDGQSVSLQRSYSAYFVPAGKGNVRFSSGDAGIAVVREDGLICVVGQGTTQIYYTSDSGNGSVTVTGLPVELVGIGGGLNPTAYASTEAIQNADLSRAIVKAIYSDGTARQLNVSDVTIDRITANSDYYQRIPISYQGRFASITLMLDAELAQNTYSTYLNELKGEYRDIVIVPQITTLTLADGSTYSNSGYGLTASPVETPTQPATEAPTQVQTEAPTEAPTQAQTEAPTEATTEAVTEAPTQAATEPVSEGSLETTSQPDTQPATLDVTETTTQMQTIDFSQPVKPTSMKDRFKGKIDWTIVGLVFFIILMFVFIILLVLRRGENPGSNREHRVQNSGTARNKTSGIKTSGNKTSRNIDTDTDFQSDRPNTSTKKVNKDVPVRKKRK